MRALTPLYVRAESIQLGLKKSVKASVLSFTVGDGGVVKVLKLVYVKLEC